MINNVKDVNTNSLQEELNQISKRTGLKNISEALKFPRYFQIENTRNCNARCPFCAIDEWDKSVLNMSDELFNKIVNEMKKYSDFIISVAIQRAGEPLLDKKIGSKISMLKNAGIKHVNLSTNASPLTESKAHDLISSGLDELIISFDYLDKEKYEKTRVGLKYEQVLRNVIKFFEIRNKTKSSCNIRVRGVAPADIHTDSFKKELAEWKDYWSQYTRKGDRVYMKQLHNWGNQVLDDSEYPDYDDAYHPCAMPWSTMHITTSGKVALCGQDFDAKVKLGDVNIDTIKEVWNSERQNWVREMHANGDRNNISFCQKCHLWDLDFSLENHSK